MTKALIEISGGCITRGNEPRAQPYTNQNMAMERVFRSLHQICDCINMGNNQSKTKKREKYSLSDMMKYLTNNVYNVRYFRAQDIICVLTLL